jgi:pyrroline-5-carboxylate reductase
MKKIGFIGIGAMGRMLLEGFLRSGALLENEILLSTKNPDKLKEAAKNWPGIRTGSNREVVRDSDVIIICVKPLQVREVLAEIRDVLRPEKHLVSIAGCVTLKELETFHAGPVTRFIPTYVSEVGEGVSLVCHNAKCGPAEREGVRRLGSSISTVKEIRESEFEVAADLTSCAPGLFSAIFDEFTRAALRHSSLDPADAREMVAATLSGFAKLLHEKEIDFNGVIEKVATKEGITQEGVDVFREDLPKVFDRVFEKTLGKHEIIQEKVREQFYGGEKAG